MKNIKFDFIASRLYSIKVVDNTMLNIKLWRYLNTFESHIYGIHVQFRRIKADLDFEPRPEIKGVPITQAGLDIYYYIMTWDKLKKIYKKINDLVTGIQQKTESLPTEFIQGFRLWKNRARHLFGEFDNSVRNEYEHPSLEPSSTENLMMWGNINADSSGNIIAHVGNNLFAKVKLEHCTRMLDLRTDLFDLFIEHLSKKPLTKGLIEARFQIQEKIDSIVKELKEFKNNNDWTQFNELMKSLIICELHLAKNGVLIPPTNNGQSVKLHF